MHGIPKDPIIAKANLRKNNKTGSIKFQFQITLQNHSNQNSVSIAKKKKKERQRERENTGTEYRAQKKTTFTVN